jgi:hypothetical protein
MSAQVLALPFAAIMSGATARGATASTSRKPGLDGDTLYFPFSSYFHRKQAVIEFREAELKYTGNGLRIDKSHSGKHRSVYRCPSVIIPHPDGAKGSGKTQWLAETLPGFVEPSIQSGESRTVFCRRRLRELEAHAEARGLCPLQQQQQQQQQQQLLLKESHHHQQQQLQQRLLSVL